MTFQSTGSSFVMPTPAAWNRVLNSADHPYQLTENCPMADDDRDFLERAESVTEKLNGQPVPIDQIADNFALYGLQKRAATLEDFDAELKGEIESGSHSLRRQVRLMALRKKMGNVHQALRKAKR
jgi:hypothetical protein